MSDGTKIFIKTNILRLHENFVWWTDQIGDMTSAFEKFIPEFQKQREGWIYAGRNVDGKRFPQLSPKYKAWKSRKFGNQKILILHGFLINAIRGGSGWGQKVGKKELEMSIDLPYATTHEFGDPARKIPQRNYFLTKDGTLNKMDYAQLMQAMEGKIDEDIKARLNHI